MPKEKHNNSKEEVYLIKDFGKYEVQCDCCGREWNSKYGRHLINGNFICNECGEECNPKKDQCFITRRKREFKFD